MTTPVLDLLFQAVVALRADPRGREGRGRRARARRRAAPRRARSGLRQAHAGEAWARSPSTISIRGCSASSPSTKSTACARTSRQGLGLYRIRVRFSLTTIDTRARRAQGERAAPRRDHHVPADGRGRGHRHDRARDPDGEPRVGRAAARRHQGARRRHRRGPASRRAERARPAFAATPVPSRGGVRAARPRWATLPAMPATRAGSEAELPAGAEHALDGAARSGPSAPARGQRSRRARCRFVRSARPCASTSASSTA